MGRFLRAAQVLFLGAFVSACAASSAIESLPKAKDARLARLYFLREKGVLGALGGGIAAEVKIDGQSIGSVTNGGYIFVDRPPGTYKLSVQSGLSAAFETETQVAGGGSYYFNIGVPRMGSPGQDLVNQAFAGGRGEQMRGTSTLFSAAVLFRLDPSTGAAEIQNLKAP